MAIATRCTAFVKKKRIAGWWADCPAFLNGGKTEDLRVTGLHTFKTLRQREIQYSLHDSVKILTKFGSHYWWFRWLGGGFLAYLSCIEEIGY